MSFKQKKIWGLLIILAVFVLALSVSAGGKEVRDEIVRIAKEQQGKPYVWGAAGPSSFDCSGFVNYVYYRAGAGLPGYEIGVHGPVAKQLYSFSDVVSDLLPGDLLFERNSGGRTGITHVGLYLGNEQAIEAGTTKGVAIYALSRWTNSPYFAGGARIRAQYWPDKDNSYIGAPTPIPLPAPGLQLEYPEWFPLRTGMSLVELVGAIFNVLLTVAGVATFLMIVAGGFRYLTSAGDPSKMADAKDQVFNAITGLVLLVSSFIILNYIGPELVELKEPEMEGMTTAPEPVLPTPPTPPEIKAITPINLGQAINETINFLETKNVVGAMTEFAKSAIGRNAQQNCEGHSCQYQFMVQKVMQGCDPCSEDDEWCSLPWFGGGTISLCFGGCCLLTSMPDIVTEEPYYDVPQSCTPASCNAAVAETCPDPNAENGINTAINEIETAAKKGLLTDEDKLRLRLAKDAVEECITSEEKILRDCKDTKDWFGGRAPAPGIEELNNCQAGRDFYCIWAEGEPGEEKGKTIIFPIEPLKEAYEGIDKLVEASKDCQCKNVNCTCSPSPPIGETITKFWCQQDAPILEQGCHTKDGDIFNYRDKPPYQCEAPCDPRNESSPFPPEFATKKGDAEKIAGPKIGEQGDDGLRQFYAKLAGITGQVKTTSRGEGLYLCEDIKSMLGYKNTETGYLWTQNPAYCPSYAIFPCCPTNLIQDIINCQPTDFFVCGEITGGPVVPTMCAAKCQDNPCTTYVDCIGSSGLCQGGKYCCQGSCTEAPTGPPWPMVCDAGRIPDCGATGLIQSSKQWDDATQVLKNLIQCIYTTAPINPGPISSISDPNIVGRGGKNSCKHTNNANCGCCINSATGLPALFCSATGVTCGDTNSCRHQCGSWHYGGFCTVVKPTRETSFSYAMELRDQHKIPSLTETIAACGGAPAAEKDHTGIMVHMDSILNRPDKCPD